MKHQAADTLSRLPTTGTDNFNSEDDLPLLGVDVINDGAPTVHFIDEHMHDDQHDTTTRVVASTKQTDANDNEPPCIQKIVRKQSLDSLCRAATRSVRHSQSKCNLDRHRLLVRRLRVEGSIQAVVPQ